MIVGAKETSKRRTAQVRVLRSKAGNSKVTWHIQGNKRGAVAVTVVQAQESILSHSCFSFPLSFFFFLVFFFQHDTGTGVKQRKKGRAF